MISANYLPTSFDLFQFVVIIVTDFCLRIRLSFLNIISKSPAIECNTIRFEIFNHLFFENPPPQVVIIIKDHSAIFQ